MKLALVIRRLRQSPWPAGQWSHALAAALARRGHEVTLLTRRAEQTPSAPGVVVRAPAEPDPRAPASGISRWRAWVDRQLQTEQVDLTLSRDGAIPCDVWLPAHGGTVESLEPARSPLLTALAPPSMTHLFKPKAPSLSRLSMATLREVIVFGQTDAEALRKRLLGLGDRITAIGWGSTVQPLPESAACDLRLRTRALFDLDDETCAVLLLTTLDVRDALRLAMVAMAQLRRRTKRRVALLVAGPSPLRTVMLAKEQGCADIVTPIGRTTQWRALLGACDMALAIGRPAQGLCSHLIADCLRMGKPVIADRRHPGAELLAPGALGPEAPGVIVERFDADLFRRAIEAMLSPARLAGASRAAASAQETLSIDSFAQRLEQRLIRLHKRAPIAANGAQIPERSAPAALRRPS